MCVLWPNYQWSALIWCPSGWGGPPSWVAGKAIKFRPLFPQPPICGQKFLSNIIFCSFLDRQNFSKSATDLEQNCIVLGTYEKSASHHHHYLEALHEEQMERLPLSCLLLHNRLPLTLTINPSRPQLVKSSFCVLGRKKVNSEIYSAITNVTGRGLLKQSWPRLIQTSGWGHLIAKVKEQCFLFSMSWPVIWNKVHEKRGLNPRP